MKVSLIACNKPSAGNLFCLADYDADFGKADEMFKDVSLSRDLQKRYLKGNKQDQWITFMVLQTSCWEMNRKELSKKEVEENKLYTIDLPAEVRF